MSQAEADAFKNEGNEHFKANRFHAAVQSYSKALELQRTPVLLCNRAFAYLKLELPGSAMMDADEAISIESGFVKAYYRKATAHILLGKFKEALKDLTTLVKLVPNDADAKAKYDACNKEVSRIRFLNAINSPDAPSPSQTIKLDQLKVDAGYTGPRIGSDGVLTLEFVEAMMEQFRQEKLIAKADVIRILVQVLRFQDAAELCFGQHP